MSNQEPFDPKPKPKPEPEVTAERVGCSFTTVSPTVVNTTEPVIAKIPVVIQEIAVQIDLMASITLNKHKPALEIKRVKNRLKVTQCRLLQTTGKLFLRGFVRQNIEYVSICHPPVATSDAICGDVLDCTFDIPFDCLADISTFISDPLFGGYNANSEFEYFSRSALPPEKFPEKERLLAGDLSEFNQQTVENFTEPPYCELISNTITQFLEFIDRKDVYNGPFEEKTFTDIEEKMDIVLNLKILQKQQVCVRATNACSSDPCDQT